MSTWRLMDGVSGRPGVGSSGTQPPSSAASLTGNYLAGLDFQVTSSVYLQGYWWWVPGTNGSTTAQKFALWQVVGNTTGALVPNSTVTSGTLTAGQFNFVTLPAPVALSQFIPYVAATGFASVSPIGFPDTTNQFNTGNPYSAGIVNGPLSAYAAGGGPTGNVPQMPFSTSSGADPSAAMPTLNNLNDLLWIDVQVTDQAPAGVTYRTFPSMIAPWPSVQTANDQSGYTLGLEFSVTRPCALSKIWHYSTKASDGAAATVLPTRCLLWNVATQTAVSGTDNASPSWKDPGGGGASAADGWVYCDYSASGVILQPGVNFKASTYHAAGSNWFGATPSIWGPGNLYAAGIRQGPLVVPNNAAASPGQQSWATAAFAYPTASANPEADWIDVEVVPLGLPAGPAAGQSARVIESYRFTQ